MKNPRSQFIKAILLSNNIPCTYTNAKGKKAKTISGHDDGLRFASPHRIKFEVSSGITNKYKLEYALKKIGVINIIPTIASGGKLDQGNGFLVEWNSIKFVILLKGNIAKGEVRRKQTTPADLGLAGNTYNNVNELYSATINGINILQVDNTVKSTLLDLVNSVYNDTTFSNSNSLKSSNFIQSDFGEILAGLYRAKLLDIIKFPANANNDSSDFFANGIGYSVKAPNGDHLNLRGYKNQITGTTPIDLFFKACATSDYQLLFKSLHTDKGICQDLYHWVEKISGAKEEVTLDDIRQFMRKISYSEFLQWLKEKQPNRRPLGIPTDKKMHIANDLWNKQDVNPFFFAYITLAQKIWGADKVKEISQFAKKVLKQDASIFITVNINSKTQKIEFIKQPFTEVNTWGIWYLGYCDSAVKNWPGICRTKETK